jgi:hypothetical protein
MARKLELLRDLFKYARDWWMRFHDTVISHDSDNQRARSRCLEDF